MAATGGDTDLWLMQMTLRTGGPAVVREEADTSAPAADRIDLSDVVTTTHRREGIGDRLMGMMMVATTVTVHTDMIRNSRPESSPTDFPSHN